MRKRGDEPRGGGRKGREWDWGGDIPLGWAVNRNELGVEEICAYAVVEALLFAEVNEGVFG